MPAKNLIDNKCISVTSMLKVITIHPNKQNDI
jgi:hypothetical protein